VILEGNYAKKEDNKVGNKLWRARKWGSVSGKNGNAWLVQKLWILVGS